MNEFSYNVQDDGLAFLTLNRHPVNALSNSFVKSLSELFDEISFDSKIKIPLQGQGQNLAYAEKINSAAISILIIQIIFFFLTYLTNGIEK